ncbi:aspartate kinase domain protein, partial [Vibrio parahaemolyticus 861]
GSFARSGRVLQRVISESGRRRQSATLCW